MQAALKNRKIKAINLLRNYGQHTATFCGFQKASGDYVITLDDDMQNPPDEIIHLIKKAKEGYDVVFGKYREKKHSYYRNLGSLIIQKVNKRIFNIPDGLTTSNFRIIRKDVLERICSYRTNYPYIQGLALMFSSNPTNVFVKHEARVGGQSTYSLLKTLEVASRILFNYSSYPLRVVSLGGFLFSFIAFLLAIYYLVRALYLGISVPGWATIVISLSFFSSIILLVLSMLGEYTVRLIMQLNYPRQFFIIKEQIN